MNSLVLFLDYKEYSLRLNDNKDSSVFCCMLYIRVEEAYIVNVHMYLMMHSYSMYTLYNLNFPSFFKHKFTF